MEHDEKKIKEFVDKLISKECLEKAPLDFTEAVMSRVETISTSKVAVYKPLIPKYVWFIILTGFLFLVGYVSLKGSSATSNWLNTVDLSFLQLNLFEDIPFTFSKTMMYAIVLFSIMVTIQVPLLKQYFDKRLRF